MLQELEMVRQRLLAAEEREIIKSEKKELADIKEELSRYVPLMHLPSFVRLLALVAAMYARLSVMLSCFVLKTSFKRHGEHLKSSAHTAAYRKSI